MRRSHSGNSDSLRGIVCLTIGNVLVMAFSAGVIVFVAWMDKSFVSDEEVAAGEGLGTDVAYEWFLFCMCTDMSLKVLLQATLILWWRRRIAEDMWY